MSDVEKLVKNVSKYLKRLETEVWKMDELYLNVSDESVNRILNVVIDICNMDRGYSLLYSANKIVNTLKDFCIKEETRERLERNERILADNMMQCLLSRPNLHTNYGGRFDCNASPKPYFSKEDNIRRRIKRLLAGLIAIGIFILMLKNIPMITSFLGGNITPWIIIFFSLFLLAFIVSLPALEVANDPTDISGVTNFWNDTSSDSLPPGLWLLPFFILWLIVLCSAKLASLIK